MLTYLDVSGNEYTGILPDSLCNFTSLQELLLASNTFSSLPACMPSLTRLLTLGIAGNNFSGTLPTSFAPLLSGLQRLTVLGSGFCGPVPGDRPPDDGPLPSCDQLHPPTTSPSVTVIAVSTVVALLCSALLLVLIWRMRRRRLAMPADSESMAAALLGDDLQHLTSVGWKADVADVKLQRRIGGGGFAAVYAARWCGSTVAVKVFKQFGMVLLKSQSSGTDTTDAPRAGEVSWLPASVESISSVDAISNELAFLSQLRHPNIVAIYAFVSRPPMLIMELASAGSLRALLRRSTIDSLSWLQRLDICGGVASGVEFLHKQSPAIIHLDLKCANVFLDDALVPKVGDFGLSMLPASHRNRVGGTPRFMAPEVALAQVITNWESIDVYGFGAIAYDVAHTNTDDEESFDSARTHLDLLGPNEVIALRVREKFAMPISAHVPPGLAAIIAACLAIEPDARPSMTDARRALDELYLELAGTERGSGGERDGAGGMFMDDDFRDALTMAIPEVN